MAPIILQSKPAKKSATVSLKQSSPLLRSETEKLVAASTQVTVLTASDSAAAATTLSAIKKLRIWISGVYADASAPLLLARKTLQKQESDLLLPLSVAEKHLTTEILGFSESQRVLREELAKRDLDVVLQGGVPETRDIGHTATANPLYARSTFAGRVDDLSELTLSIAAGILLSKPDIPPAVREFLLSRCRPTRQASLSMLQPSSPEINALARALKNDLDLPGVSIVKNTTLVAK